MRKVWICVQFPGPLSDQINRTPSPLQNEYFSIDMLNEMRDTVSKCSSLSDQSTEITSGNSCISVPQNTPAQNTSSVTQNTSWQSTLSDPQIKCGCTQNASLELAAENAVSII